jgi:hypothetical protein
MIESARAGSVQAVYNEVQKARFRRLELVACRKLCQIYLEEGKVALARPLAELLVAASEKGELSAEESGYAWSELGTIALDEGRPSDALKAFENETKFYNKGMVVQPAWSAGLRGAAYLALGDYQRAEPLMTNSLPVLEHRFTITHFRVQRAYRDLIRLYLKTGHEQAADECRIRLARGLNEVAWQFATSNNPKRRNGARAVELAEEAVHNTNRKNPAYLKTLAAAYAEDQQFEKAVVTEKEAHALGHDQNSTTDFRSRLELYESNQPYHQ